MIDSIDIITELMDEMGWVYLPEWDAKFRGVRYAHKLLFEKKVSEAPGAVEVSPGVYVVPKGIPPKQFTVKDRTVSWKTSDGNVKTVDLAEPGSLEEIISYVSR